jgi:hypothetical protein
MSKLSPPPTAYSEIQTKRVLDDHTDPLLATSGSPDGAQDYVSNSTEGSEPSSTEEMDLSEPNDNEMGESLSIWLATRGECIFRKEAKEWLKQYGPNLLAVHIISERKAIVKQPVEKKPK